MMRTETIVNVSAFAILLTVCGMIEPRQQSNPDAAPPTNASVPPAALVATPATLTKMHLRQAEVQTLDIAQISDEARAAEEPVVIVVSLDGQERTLLLCPHSVRDPEFRLLVQGEGGTYVDTPPPAPRTFRGQVAGIDGSKVAASLGDDQMYAAIFLPDQDFYWSIQPLSDGQAGAPRSAHLVYRSSDTEDGPWTCGTPLEWQLGSRPTGEERSAGPGPMKVCEVAVDSDFEFFFANGQSVANTLFDLEIIMNRVETLYEIHTGIRITYETTVAIVRTLPADSYTSPEPVSLLNEFQLKWNNLMQPVQRDTAHLFTGKPNGLIIGIAYVGVVCNIGSAYGLSYSRFSNNIVFRTCLTAHEIGHNWSANHCDGQSDCGIMCSAIGSCSGNCQLFGVSSVNEIAAHRNAVGCLIDEPAPLALPFVDTFPGPAMDGNKWIYNKGATLSVNATNEPSPPLSLNLNSVGANPYLNDDIRTHFILAASAGDNLKLRYFTQNRDVPSGGQLVVEYWNNALRWVELNRIVSDGATQSVFTAWSHDLPAAARHNELRMRFRTENADATGNWYVDNVEVVEVVPPCPADINNDGFVNVTDLLLVINNWGACAPPGTCTGDINNDGQVNVTDLLAVINNWGQC